LLDAAVEFHFLISLWRHARPKFQRFTLDTFVWLAKLTVKTSAFINGVKGWLWLNARLFLTSVLIRLNGAASLCKHLPLQLFDVLLFACEISKALLFCKGSLSRQLCLVLDPLALSSLLLLALVISLLFKLQL
jgi:hypothetical protein